MELGQDLASVRGEGHEDTQVGQRHQRHIVLGVGPRLGVSDQIYSILRFVQNNVGVKYMDSAA